LLPSSNESASANSDQLTVYPNPASDFLQFDLPKDDMPASVELYNAAGQQVISQQLTDNTLMLKDLPSGFYSYQLRRDDRVYSGKVIVE